MQCLINQGIYKGWACVIFFFLAPQSVLNQNKSEWQLSVKPEQAVTLETAGFLRMRDTICWYLLHNEVICLSTWWNWVLYYKIKGLQIWSRNKRKGWSVKIKAKISWQESELSVALRVTSNLLLKCSEQYICPIKSRIINLEIVKNGTNCKWIYSLSSPSLLLALAVAASFQMCSTGDVLMWGHEEKLAP